MKTLTPLQRMISILIVLLGYFSMAQSYSFTLIQNSDYNFTIAAVSEFDSGSFQPITQSYGFTLVLPDGITISIDEVFPSGTNETVTPIPGTNVAGIDATMADKDLFLITTDTSGRAISAHGNGTMIPLVTLTVNGNPTSGEIRVLDNTSILASSSTLNGALDAFFLVDIIDDSMVNFTNEFNKLNGFEAFDFATLSIEMIEGTNTELSLYPNPAKEEVQIEANGITLEKVEIYDISGKRVLQSESSLTQIDISGLESGVYMVKLYTDTGIEKTVKLVKE